jgi:inorganic pyrophosphatase/exopolyphosphatase
MSTLTGFLIVGVVLASSLAGAYWLIRRKAARAESERDRVVREATVHDVGPDSLRLLKDLDLHLNLYLVDHRDIAEGLARLDQAVCDHHTNTTEGEA